MIEFQRLTHRQRQLNLTPLIDVVFLLVVFFMITTTFVKTESIELAFPDGGQVEQAQKRNVIVIVMVDSGRLYLGKTPITREALTESLRASLSLDPARNILLMSSELNSVQEVVEIMDLVYQAGGKNVAVSNWRPRER